MGVNDAAVQNEYERERVRGVHLAIVIVYNISAAAIFFESLLLGWEY